MNRKDYDDLIERMHSNPPPKQFYYMGANEYKEYSKDPEEYFNGLAKRLMRMIEGGNGG